MSEDCQPAAQCEPFTFLRGQKMVFEPISGTIGALDFFTGGLETCHKLYEAYRLSRSFGEDFMRLQLELDLRWSNLSAIGQIPRSQVANHVNPYDNNFREKVETQVAVIKDHFDACHKIMKKYHELGTLSNRATPV